MCLYDYREYEQLPWASRFPADCVGGDAWHSQASGPAWYGAEFEPPAPREVATDGLSASRPVLFLSHRKCDSMMALRLAWIADQEGFELWLDVVNPNLQPLQSHIGAGPLSLSQTSLAIAQTLEMGLFNSTHLLLVMTPNTVGSAWLPYQFGRAVTRENGELQLASWASQQVPKSTLPEYLALGAQFFCEDEYRTWLRREFQDWTSRIGSSARGPAMRWAFPEPLEI